MLPKIKESKTMDCPSCVSFIEGTGFQETLGLSPEKTPMGIGRGCSEGSLNAESIGWPMGWVPFGLYMNVLWRKLEPV